MNVCLPRFDWIFQWESGATDGKKNNKKPCILIHSIGNQDKSVWSLALLGVSQQTGDKNCQATSAKTVM